MLKHVLFAGLVSLAPTAGVRAAVSPSSLTDEWPEFRGPGSQGISTATGLPVEWSSTRNVVWRQPVAGLGWSTPVVAGGRIFLTSGLTKSEGGPSLRAVCLAADTGRELWTTEIFAPAEINDVPVHAKNSPASPSIVAEPNRLYVHFGHHGTACLDWDGKMVWRNKDLGYEPVHGNGGSPLVVDDRLIYSADGGRAPFVVALDKKSGAVLWKFARDVAVKQPFSFCTPLLISVSGRPQVVMPGSGAVSALDPADGREIWRVRYGQGYSVVPRPVYAQGLVFVATGYNRADLLALRPDGDGDVTDTHVAWRTTKGAPLTPSVIAIGEEVYAVSDMGVASCFDARTGNLHWQERLDGNYSASPVAAEGRIYFQNETGTGTVLKAGREFVKLATNKLEGRTLASYAIALNSLFIRTDRHLYRIAQRDGAPPGE